jgi:ribosome-binding protein aMBF1 (putative translation factor)
MEDYENESVVEAIDGGRIVQVPERYALREGLPILRRKELSFLGSPEKQAAMKEMNKKERRGADRMDSLRRPLKIKDNILATLIDNFHWQIVSKRREVNWSRKQFAEKVGVSENDIKTIENGILPKEDYILINKIEQVFGINLRKEGIIEAPKIVSLKEKNPPVFLPKSKDRTDRDFASKKAESRILGDDISIDFED